MDWYATALGELREKIAEAEAIRDASNASKGTVYFSALKVRRFKAELNKLLESRARLAKFCESRGPNA